MFLYLKPVLLFSFQDFEIQSSHRCGLDWISIGTYKNLDGYRACGSSIPAPYISSQDHVWIKFHSDDSTTGKGFRLSYITGRPAINSPLNTAVSERMQLRRYSHRHATLVNSITRNCIWLLKNKLLFKSALTSFLNRFLSKASIIVVIAQT